MEPLTFAQRLALMRKRRNLELSELAAKAETTYQTLWRIEHRNAEPGIYLATRLARALDCSLDYLCGLYGDERDKRPADIACDQACAISAGVMHPEMAPL